MAGLYDWLLNSLRADQSPLTNQLPTPIPSQNLTGLPVPFQNMPSESASYSPFMKLPNYFTNANVNPVITQDTGTNPTAPNDPLKTYKQYAGLATNILGGANGLLGKSANSEKNDNQLPILPVNAGNAVTPNFRPTAPLFSGSNTNTSRSAMLMKMLQEMPMNYGESA